MNLKCTKAYYLGKRTAWEEKGRLSVLLILLQFLSLAAFSQGGIRVTGTVTDTKGEALPGVSVKQKGSSTGVTTSLDGKYAINVTDKNATIVFTYIGFAPKEESVGNRTIINTSLLETINTLDQVVVTGYGGTQKKRDLAGSTASVSSEDIAERQPVNIFDALQGKAAGVLVVNDGGGAPGAEGTVQIRGLSTLNGGNGPLYLVDGVINPNGASINPNDIESIEVLKDAASASIYGARAANGVILITTKRGQDGKPRIDVQLTHTLGRLANKLPQSNAAEVRAFRIIQGRDPNSGGGADTLNPGFNSDNDQQDLLMGQTAKKTQLNLGLSGGLKGFSYYAGVNYLDDQSIILNSWIKRIQTRVNIDYQVTPKLKYGNNISFNWQNGNQVPIARTVAVIFDRPAFSRIYYPDGSLTSYIGSKRNPVANALYEKNEAQTIFGQFNNRLEYNFLKELKWTNMFNVSLEQDQELTFSPRFVDDGKTDNSNTTGIDRDFRWEFQSFLNYNKTFRKDHAVQALLGFSADRRRYDEYQLRSEDAVYEDIYVINPAFLVQKDSRSSATANTGQNVFSRLNYSYKGKYILAGVFRRDASSRFGTENRAGNFYSGSAAWRFSDEKFMTWSKKVLYDGKLRFSYGKVGNDRIGDDSQFTKIIFDGSYASSPSSKLSTTFGNNALQWEVNESINLGTDLSFLNGRLTFTADLYDKTTSDLLYTRDLPKETGFLTVPVNLGAIQNRGLELVLGGAPIFKPKFKWEVSGNITFERGTIKELADGIPLSVGNKWYVEEGGKIGNFIGWRNLGVFRWDVSNNYTPEGERLEPVNVAADGKSAEYYTLNGVKYEGARRQMKAPEGTLLGGDTEWRDLNGDFLIDDKDRHVIGNAQPDFYFGLFNNFSFKSFTLSFLFNGSFGGEVYNTLQYNANYPSNTGSGHPMVVYNSWRKQGDIATLPYYIDRASRGSLKQHGNSLYIEDASFVRLSSMRLSYNLKPQWAKKIFTKGLTAYVWGSNLATWTNYTGYDPEFSATNALTPGDDTGRYPKRRELGFGLNVNL